MDLEEEESVDVINNKIEEENVAEKPKNPKCRKQKNHCFLIQMELRIKFKIQNRTKKMRNC